MTTKNLETQVHIDATPQQIWSVLADLKSMPRWSPQCRLMWPLGRLRTGAYTVNWNRHGRRFWPTVSQVVQYEPNRGLAFRTLTNYSIWSFQITPTATGSTLVEHRSVPEQGTAWASKTIVEHLLGGEDNFDEAMLDGMKTTVMKIKAAVEQRGASPDVV